jgi:hypothetical protein
MPGDHKCSSRFSDGEEEVALAAEVLGWAHDDEGVVSAVEEDREEDKDAPLAPRAAL